MPDLTIGVDLLANLLALVILLLTLLTSVSISVDPIAGLLGLATLILALVTATIKKSVT